MNQLISQLFPHKFIIWLTKTFFCLLMLRFFGSIITWSKVLFFICNCCELANSTFAILSVYLLKIKGVRNCSNDEICGFVIWFLKYSLVVFVSLMWNVVFFEKIITSFFCFSDYVRYTCNCPSITILTMIGWHGTKWILSAIMTSETISSNVLKNLFKLNFTKFTCYVHHMKMHKVWKQIE